MVWQRGFPWCPFFCGDGKYGTFEHREEGMYSYDDKTTATYK